MYVVYCSTIARITNLEKRSKTLDSERKINVIVYLHNDEATIASLIDSINRLDYSKQQYEVNIILDNCTDSSAKKLEILGGTKLWRINTGNTPMGKNKAFSWLFERLPFEDNEAFVFLRANCVLKPDFLTRVNYELEFNPVVFGSIISESKNTTPLLGLITYRKWFIDNVINSGRTLAGLNNIINTDICAVRRDAMNAFTFSCGNEYDAEVCYSLMLGEENFKVVYSPLVTAIKRSPDTINNCFLSINKLVMARIKAFNDNFDLLFSRHISLKHKEFILSLIYPSGFMTIVGLYVLVASSNLESYYLASYIPSLLINLYVLGCVYTITAARFQSKHLYQAINWTLYSPFVLLFNLLNNINFSVDLFKKMIFNKLQEPIEKDLLINTTLTDGLKEVTCQLEVQRHEELSQVIFWFKNKKMTSKKFLRTSDAISEIIKKLHVHGFTLKICQNCGYFELKRDGRFNCEQGKCLLGALKGDDEVEPVKYSWERCPHIIPTEAQNLIKEHLKKT